jgi:signal recognition particle subunit SRP54
VLLQTLTPQPLPFCKDDDPVPPDARWAQSGTFFVEFGKGEIAAIGIQGWYLDRDGKVMEESAVDTWVFGMDLIRGRGAEEVREFAEKLRGHYLLGTLFTAALTLSFINCRNTVIVDTAGRLQIDDGLMTELAQVTDAVSPDDVLLVVDAMTGQEAVSVAESFAATVPLTGIVLTKLDGDARGGAALSVKEVTGVPILFAGVGEKVDDFETFHPDRMASRILGMGDVLSLVEQAQKSVDAKEAEKLAKKVKSGKGFDLEDYRAQIAQMRKMGGLAGMVEKLPAELARAAQSGSVSERKMARIEGIINSMTPAERAKPELIKASRKRRIAAGAGVSVQEGNQLLAQFEQTQKMMKMVAKGGMQKMLRGMKGLMPGMR